MPRARVPMELARITGRTKRDPARFAGRVNPRTERLGKPSVWMTTEQRKAWGMFAREFPWLRESDRGLVEIAATVRARLIAGDDVGLSALNMLRLCYAQMGGSPSDRSKVELAATEAEHEAAEDACAKYFAH
jgi:hypothetical protein